MTNPNSAPGVAPCEAQSQSYTLAGAAKNALDVLEAVTRQFTRTPSSLRDSQVRGMAHEAMKELRAVLGSDGVAASFWCDKVPHGEQRCTKQCALCAEADGVAGPLKESGNG